MTKEFDAENYREAIIRVASEYIGAPSIQYRGAELGRSPEDGFDCSGFARFVLEKVGLVVPDHITVSGERQETRYASQLYDYYGIHKHPGLHQEGDLIFFSKNGLVPTHVGIVLDQETYIHAPGKDGTHVTVSRIAEKAIRQAIKGQELYSVNPIGFKSPVLPLGQESGRYHQRVA